MTLLENLQSHRGGLLRLKTQLFWYGGRAWDKNPGRLCLILDAAQATIGCPYSVASTPSVQPSAAATATVLLLIEDHPQWIRVAEADVELIDEAR